MTLEMTLWQAVTLLIAFFGACAAAGKLLLGQTQRHIDERFSMMTSAMASLEQANKEEAQQWKKLERDVMALRAELPLEYVRREDYIRGQSVIEAKLDGLAVKLENAQLRGLIGGTNHAD
ncbi:MAG: hypothetical protein ACRBBM_00520 [Pseudomonadaceae bacterium]|jgi:hypothetical protein|uniref:hypothetical protein n=1 Tax=Halopseudomonas aestusnigri TaxID=857252 RepID=UPI001D18C45B|nr:hypothetical protein [Halopseudomonas aestusnigri]MCC4259201.1 hypothetical protein [Halopseudomonas aestusnigri]